jgi:hypothetical protein
MKKERSTGEKTKPIRAKIKNIENTIQKIKENKNKSTSEAIEEICRVYEENTLTDYQLIFKRLNELKKKINGREDLKELLRNFRHAARLQNAHIDINSRMKKMLKKVDPKINSNEGGD